MVDFSIKLTTPENTVIEFQLAGIGNRMGALAIDSLIIFLFQVIVSILAAIIYMAFKDIFTEIGDTISAIIYVLLSFLTFNGYYIFFEYIWNGQSPGKRLFNIRVIRENGQPVGFLEVFIRNILRLADLLVGPYFVLFSKKEKRLGDYLSNTIVIKEKDNSLPLDDIIKVEENFNEIPNVNLLSPREFVLVGDYLKRKDNFTSSARENLLENFIVFYFDKLSLSSIYEIESPADLSKEKKMDILKDIYISYKKRGSQETI